MKRNGILRISIGVIFFSMTSSLLINRCYCVDDGDVPNDSKITNKEDKLNRWQKSINDSLEIGDLIFRCGQSISSQMVVIAGKNSDNNNNDERFSHIGILIGRDSTGQWLVCHAVPDEPEFEGDIDRVRCESVLRFLSIDKCKRAAYMHVLANDTCKSKAAQHAYQQWIKRTPFDDDFNENDSAAFYCTELIHWSYLQEKVDLTNGRRHHSSIINFKGYYIFPSDIIKSKSLRMIDEFSY